MPNGKQGDHPLTDILYHGLAVYSAKADGLVREIARLCDQKFRRNLGNSLYRDYNPYGNPDVAKLEQELVELRQRLKAQARIRGFEPDDE
jgi:hypothetical protein